MSVDERFDVEYILDGAKTESERILLKRGLEEDMERFPCLIEPEYLPINVSKDSQGTVIITPRHKGRDITGLDSMDNGMVHFSKLNLGESPYIDIFSGEGDSYRVNLKRVE